MGALEASFGTAPVLTAAFDSGAATAGLSAAVEGPFAGRDGATFTPAVGEDGTLSWTNDKGLENPAPVNIMGPAGADGATGPQGPQGEPGPAGVIGTDLYVGERARLRTTDDSRGNLQLYNAAGQTVVNAYATDAGIGELDVHGADGVMRAALYSSTSGDGVLKLKNADGEAAALFYADVARLKSLVESAEHPGCYYRVVDGQTEWLNPPMMLGVEYRTAERWNGSAVYRKILAYKFPDGLSGVGNYFVPHGIENMGQNLAVVGYNEGYVLPYLTSGSSLCITAFDTTNLRVTDNNSSWGNTWTWYFDMKYTKIS